ncbi:hypothetical protein [Agrococcus versicolor]
MSMQSSIGIAAVLGLIVLALGVAVVVAGIRRRQRRTILTGALGAVLGVAVLVPAAIAAADLLAA